MLIASEAVAVVLIYSDVSTKTRAELDINFVCVYVHVPWRTRKIRT